MKVSFKDGTIKECTAPREQKVFKGGAEAGWILTFSLSDDMTSNDVDALLVADNISELTFTSEKSVNEDGEVTNAEKSFILYGYDRITSAVIRYSEGKDKTKIEVSLIKGVNV